MQKNLLTQKEQQMMVSLELFHEVPAGVIETLFDDQNQHLFKRADLGKYLGIKDIKHNFKDFPSHYTHSRSEIEAGGQAPPPPFPSPPWEDKQSP